MTNPPGDRWPPAPRPILVCLPHLLWFESGEAEHADLVDDMLPVVRGPFLLEIGLQLLPHLNDAAGHAVDLPKPGRKSTQFTSVWI